MMNDKRPETRGYQPVNKGYQPRRMPANDGYQPSQQQTSQPVSQMKPPSTGSGIK